MFVDIATKFVGGQDRKIFCMDIGQLVAQERERRGITSHGQLAAMLRKDFGAPATLKAQNIQQLEAGAVRAPRYAFAIAKWLGLTLEELADRTTGGESYSLPAVSSGLHAREPDTDIETVEIPIYNARGSAGDGVNNGHSVMIGSLTFKRRSLDRVGLNHNNLSTIYVDGDSMSPGLKDGFVVIFDRTRRTIKHGEIYVVRYDDEMLIKRLYKLADGSLQLVSDNPDPRYAPRTIPASHLDAVDILGQVVWGGGWMM